MPWKQALLVDIVSLHLGNVTTNVATSITIDIVFDIGIER